MIAAGLGRIKEQIGRIQYPHAAAAMSERGDDVHAVEERGVLVEDAVALGIFVDRDDVLAAEFAADRMGGRRRDFVINHAPEDVPADDFQPGRVRVLDILHHPKPAALIEGQRQRLLDDRLRKHLIEAQIVRRLERPGGVGGGKLGPRSVSLPGWASATRGKATAGMRSEAAINIRFMSALLQLRFDDGDDFFEKRL